MFPRMDIFLQQPPADVCLKPVHHPSVGEALDTLGHVPIEHHIKVVLIVPGCQYLCLVLPGVDEGPGVIEENVLFGGFARAAAAAVGLEPPLGNQSTVISTF
jgi:hypothetical protein